MMEQREHRETQVGWEAQWPKQGETGERGGRITIIDDNEWIIWRYRNKRERTEDETEPTPTHGDTADKLRGSNEEGRKVTETTINYNC